MAFLFIPLIALCLNIGAAASAANYRAIDLSGPGVSAQVHGARDGKAFGAVYTGFRGRAAEWDVDTGTFTSYHTAPFEDSYLYGGVGNLRVGYAVDRDGIFARHAGITWTNKTPTEFSPIPEHNFSGIYGTDGTQHVGNASIDGFNGQPIVWFDNNPQAWRDLTPRHFGFHSGVAKAVHNGKQVGYVWGDADVHAILWRNTPASAIDLHPAAHYHWSQVNDIFNNEQVGFATTVVLTFNDAHAYIWNNTRASARDVHPLGAIRSALNGTNGIFQVGYARPAGSTVDHAFVWAGTADSAMDLHSLLPPGFVSSVAHKIDERGYIYGNAIDAAGLSHVVAWLPVPEPGAAGLMLVGLLLNRRRVRDAVGSGAHKEHSSLSPGH
jgi:hypothetical protein